MKTDVTSSYNKINGTPSCQNNDTMNRILKTELNFQGFILSDYGATHSTVASALHGMDMELPGVWYYGRRLAEAVNKGKVPIERLDDMARRILTTWFAFGQDDGYPKVNWNRFDLADQVEVNGRILYNHHVDNRGDNHILARKIAAESTV